MSIKIIHDDYTEGFFPPDWRVNEYDIEEHHHNGGTGTCSS